MCAVVSITTLTLTLAVFINTTHQNVLVDFAETGQKRSRLTIFTCLRDNTKLMNKNSSTWFDFSSSNPKFGLNLTLALMRRKWGLYVHLYVCTYNFY